ncbi:MAG: phosphoribosylformylglycinamidine cyclo-ligase [Chloroflexi bacterium]|nr:phosphoribosylformylglycinamidine cyclo-ligase [Chloroflexota bacterium]
MSAPKSTSGRSYRAAGVNRSAADRAKAMIKELARPTFGPHVLSEIGLFGGFFELPPGYRQPVLVSSVDSVGTKLKVASALGKHDTVGHDIVNHCVNDAFTSGAKPLFFLDYIGTGTLKPEQVAEVVKGLAEACQAVGCALIGGETAELPGLYQPDDYDLAGTIVSIVEKEDLIRGRGIQAGDVLVGIPSSGLHTNGYSLVRKVFRIGATPPAAWNAYYQELGCRLGEALLRPHRCYYPLLVPVLPLIKGMAHITGGGLIENTPRILPPGLVARFRRGSWPVPPLFQLIQQEGQVADEEMYHVFNMGLGMVLVLAPERVDEARRQLPEALIVGEVTAGEGETTAVVE